MRFEGYVSPLLLVSIAVGSGPDGLYRLTPLGRDMLAAGAKAAAAELSGVRVGRIFVICHILSGVLAGIAALMVVARTGAAIPSMAGDLGQDWLLPAFLGPVFGGTLLAGGRVSVLGTFLGSRARQRIDERPAAVSHRRILGADLARAAAAARGADGSRATVAPRANGESGAMTAAFSRFLRTDWFGPLAIIVAASIGISMFDPSFLSPFNIQILLLAASVNCVIAMSQMIIIAIGQMNLGDRRDRRPRRDLFRRPDAGVGSSAGSRGGGGVSRSASPPASSTAI